MILQKAFWLIAGVDNLRIDWRNNVKQFAVHLCRVHSKCLKAKRKLDHTRNIMHSSGWTHGTFQRNCSITNNRQGPTFDADRALSHFQGACTGQRQYSGLPHWVGEMMPVPDKDDLTPFDMLKLQLLHLSVILRGMYVWDVTIQSTINELCIYSWSWATELTLLVASVSFPTRLFPTFCSHLQVGV